MKNELKKEVRDYFYGEEEFFDEAYESVMSTMPTNRLMVEHTCDVDKDDLFDGIDKSIVFLKKLKEKGYTRIEERWSGYECNYFVAVKKELETDEEYYHRIATLVAEESEAIERREAQRSAAKKRIKELEDELKKLKKTI